LSAGKRFPIIGEQSLFVIFPIWSFFLLAVMVFSSLTKEKTVSFPFIFTALSFR